MAAPLDPQRRHLVQAAVAGGLLAVGSGWLRRAHAADAVSLPFENGLRELTRAFPQKGEMLLVRTRPPLLETPFSVFDDGVFTPNDRFFVRWHLAGIPTRIDAGAFRLAVHGLVERPLELSLRELARDFPHVEVAAVNQCAGNSRGFFKPRVAGGEWGNGAMGNARWSGVRLKDILDRAGVKAGAVQVRFNGLDTGVLPATPAYVKALDVDRARDGEVIVAFAMNGQPLPLLNGFPVRLVVPGWYSTYWVKMLHDIEVIDRRDDNFWMAKAYRIPDTPHASILPGQAGVATVPIGRMAPRSFITNLADGSVIALDRVQTVRGIAFGGDTGVRKVLFSPDGGASWAAARLGKDYGKYGFRRWEAQFTPRRAGQAVLRVKAINADGVEQPDAPNWNPAGYMRNVVETTNVVVA
ncbi:sulfide dehydrogenase [Burkholderia ubonensis]|uniref:molybdopterin-dependent oxidoreductase n=1 Tax=Burkholderia ubonensis TaxID=101571 RepID=UPI000754AF18|nr:molybdopterin-dependent oxidoreductase [Burkholderia ubonensis]KWI99695.1 sulfide dehydrogenase [Burkholderia ubonensis]KWK14292.1 sulfide dehydrogenase [Burkholderia ubonensis]KWK35806.1 sulfide dehydrogenase [Burkholderia ubonensis]